MLCANCLAALSLLYWIMTTRLAQFVVPCTEAAMLFWERWKTTTSGMVFLRSLHSEPAWAGISVRI